MTTSLLASALPYPVPTDPGDRLRRAVIDLSAARTETGRALTNRINRVSQELDEIAHQLTAPERRPTLKIVPPLTPTDDLIVDPVAFAAQVGGEPITLTYREFRLLLTFAENRGQVLSRADLLRLAWDRQLRDSPRTVDVHVRRLRVRLGTAATRLATVRNVGYRFD